MKNHIHQSNLIEGINSKQEDILSLMGWDYILSKNIIDRVAMLELHRLITVNQLEVRDSGHYRAANVVVGGRLCPQPYLALQLIHNWILDMQNLEGLDPIQMHIRFEKIHPFIDGNGRVGRMLLWWHEIKLGRHPTLFLNSEKDRVYYPLFK